MIEVGTAITKMLRVNMRLRPKRVAEVGHDHAANGRAR